MAEAPNPKTLKRHRERDAKRQAAQTVMRFDYDPDGDGTEKRSNELVVATLGAKESRLIQVETGRPLEYWLTPYIGGADEAEARISLGAVAVLWWAARLQAGETVTETDGDTTRTRPVTLDDVDDELTLDAIADGRFELTVIDLDDDDLPEGESGEG